MAADERQSHGQYEGKGEQQAREGRCAIQGYDPHLIPVHRYISGSKRRILIVPDEYMGPVAARRCDGYHRRCRGSVTAITFAVLFRKNGLIRRRVAAPKAFYMASRVAWSRSRSMI